MTASQSGVFSVQEFTDGSIVLVGGRLYTYVAGTTTFKTAYTDAAGLVPQTYTSDGLGGQYIALNARGELPAPLYLTTGSYDLCLKRADGTTVWTRQADPTGDAAAAIGTSILASLASSIGTSLIGYIMAGIGAVLRTLQAKIRDSVAVHPRDFGCVCDGVTDDTINFQRMLNEVSASRIYGGGVAIGLSAQVTKNLAAGADFELKGIRPKSLGIPDIDAGFIVITGPGTGAVASVAAATKGSSTLTVTSGAVPVAGTDLLLKSSDLWCDIALTGRPSVTMGEQITVKSVAGSVITLTAPIRYDYTTSPTVTTVSLAGTVIVENVIGTSDNTSFAHCPVQIQYTKVARAKNVMGNLCSYAGIYFAWCKYVFSEDCGNENPDPALGLGYGVLTAYATREAEHVRPRGVGCRHVSAKGGYDSIICSITDIDATGDNQQEAVIDAHENIDEQIILGGGASFVNNVNGKLASVQSRRLRVWGMRGQGMAVGIVASPCCTVYPSAVIIEGVDVSALTNGVDIEMRSPQPMEYLKISGHIVGGTGGVQGDGIIVTTSSSYVNVGGTNPPGQYKTVEIDARVFGTTQRGVYIQGPAGKGQTYGDVHFKGHFESGTAAGQFPIYVNVATVGDVTSVEAFGDFTGGNQNCLRIDNAASAYARIFARNFGQDAIFNNQNGASDALNRFDLQAITPSTAGIDQHRGQFTANGATAVTVNNSSVRSGSRFMFALKTAGGTPGTPRPGTIVSGTSVQFSSTAGDTSTWWYWLENPTTGP